MALKWDYSDRRKKQGRPVTDPEIVKLVVKFAKENPAWGYDRIAGALANVGHFVSDQTVGNILKSHGFEPAPDRDGTSWKTFLKAHWDTRAAIDFTNVEVWTPRGLVTFSLLFAIELKTRRVHFAGCVTTSDGGKSMQRMAMNMTDCEDGFLSGKSHLIMDNDTRFSEVFCRIQSDVDIEPVKIAPRCPRFMKSIKHEVLNRMIFFGEGSLRNAVKQYLRHYHQERNHQGLDNQLIVSLDRQPDMAAPIETIEKLGGMLKHYRRAA